MDNDATSNDEIVAQINKRRDDLSISQIELASLLRDTANTFWTSVKYEFEGLKQNIIPLNIQQLISILKCIKKMKSTGKKIKHTDLKLFYDTVLNVSSIGSSVEWLDYIKSGLVNWVNTLVS